MKIELKETTIRELTKNYQDNEEGGVFGYDGKLDIRPPFQREFVYNDKQRDAVIDTIKKGFPLNVMYWAVKADGSYEIIDGQQRTISICQYVNGDFSFDKMYFFNLEEDEKNQILDEYKLMIYLCSGTDSQKLEWFKTINIAGAKLFDQELRNAVYSGSWVTDAKRYFSKNNCPAYGIAKDYMSGKPIRQDYLETAIKWISKNNIEEYMAKHQHEPNANELWLYFKRVIDWVQAVFPVSRKEIMQGIEWGPLYDEFNDKKFDSTKLEKEIIELLQDDDVTSQKGIYPYILTRNPKFLNIRLFTSKQKREAYERQKGMCVKCEGKFKFDDMEGDHVIPWHKGGKTSAENCQMLCKECNGRKSNK